MFLCSAQPPCQWAQKRPRPLRSIANKRTSAGGEAHCPAGHGAWGAQRVGDPNPTQPNADATAIAVGRQRRVAPLAAFNIHRHGMPMAIAQAITWEAADPQRTISSRIKTRTFTKVTASTWRTSMGSSVPRPHRHVGPHDRDLQAGCAQGSAQVGTNHHVQGFT